MTDYDRMVDELAAEYGRRRARTGELHRQLREVSATSTGARGAVRVTVGAQGEVRNIEFPTGAYKRMAPLELTAALLGAIGKAQEKALAKVAEVMGPELTAGGPGFLDIFTGKAELPAAAGEPGMPGVVREYLEGGRGRG